MKNELKIALRRIDDLQAAIGGEMDSDFVSDQVLYCVNCATSWGDVTLGCRGIYFTLKHLLNLGLLGLLWELGMGSIWKVYWEIWTKYGGKFGH